MKKKRIIPVLLLKNGWLVQSKQFREHQNLGNPVAAVKRLSEWASDELIYLDISKSEKYDLKRDDLRVPNRKSITEILDDVASAAFMPMTVGGRIRTIADIHLRLQHGADKVTINTKPIEDNKFISQASKEFGSQCIVVSIDVKKDGEKYEVMSHGGSTKTGLDPVEWAKRCEGEGAGEILLNSIDRDGMRNGYDIPLLKSVSNAVKIPVIALGGVGDWQHLAQALIETNVDAVAAANIFHYVDQSIVLARKYLVSQSLNVRPPTLIELDGRV